MPHLPGVDNLQSHPEAMHTDVVTLNMGPQHPSTHGALRLILKLDGERVVWAQPDIGYIHRGFEKMAEAMTYTQYVYLTDRLDYLSAIFNEWGYCLACEALAQIEVPRRAEYLRVLAGELCRLSSHLVWLGAMGMDVGAFTPLTYTFREREMILDLFDMLCGQRMTFNYCRIGGVARDLPAGFADRVRAFLKHFKRMPDMYDRLLSDNPIFIARMQGVGVLPAELAHAHAVTGPNLRGSGVALDLRRSTPYSAYPEFDFDVCTQPQGDALARYRVRLEEMRQSARIIAQSLEGVPEGEIMGKAPRVFKPPAGEAYLRLESSRGVQGFYLVSDGGSKPARCRIRVPSFANLSVLPAILPGVQMADVVAIIGSIDFIVPEVDR
ncbi:NADH-quinone oxidoreductase subunit D [candidate division FCPU426 bacterium]|nr:NADH-quinone oxidoreductase subunit D [candidate division FCPU426 bacterium]